MSRIENRLTPEQTKMVLENQKLVYTILKRMPEMFIKENGMEDLEQEGLISLIKAAKSYNGKYKFSTYACRAIYNNFKIMIRAHYAEHRKSNINCLSLDRKYTIPGTGESFYSDVIKDENVHFDYDLEISEIANEIENMAKEKGLSYLLPYYKGERQLQDILKERKATRQNLARYQNRFFEYVRTKFKTYEKNDGL